MSHKIILDTLKKAMLEEQLDFGLIDTSRFSNMIAIQYVTPAKKIYIGEFSDDEFFSAKNKKYLAWWTINPFERERGYLTTKSFDEFLSIVIEKWIACIKFLTSPEYEKQRATNTKVFGHRPGKKINLKRPDKGSSLLAMLQDFVVIDIETTGLDPNFDEIIEIAALKIRNGETIDTFQTLIKPDHEISDFITMYTGISNEMVLDAPKLISILPKFIEFTKADTLVGHNINFDINFLYDMMKKYFNVSLDNNFVDTMRLGRRVLQGVKNFKLETLAEHFKIDVTTSHRALNDCETTASVYFAMCDYIKKSKLDLDNLPKQQKKFEKNTKKITDIKPQFDDLDESHQLYGKSMVFTGALASLTREEAMQMAVNVGALAKGSVSKVTNFLVLGNLDYTKYQIKDDKSSKQKKAEDLILKGYDLKIISETVFLDMISE